MRAQPRAPTSTRRAASSKRCRGHRAVDRRTTSRCGRSRWPDAFLDSDLVVKRGNGRNARSQRSCPQRSVAPVARLCSDAPMEKQLMNAMKLTCSMPESARHDSSRRQCARRSARRHLSRAAEILSGRCRCVERVAAPADCSARRWRSSANTLPERAPCSTCRSLPGYAVPARRLDGDRRRPVRRDDHVRRARCAGAVDSSARARGGCCDGAQSADDRHSVPPDRRRATAH